jgi:RNA polymerase sigma-70 factor (ECF subfamily)
MDDRDWLAERFEAERRQLWAVAYRLLGSNAEANDAVQEAWLRLARSDAAPIENLGAWLTMVVSRVALNMLRSRRTHQEEPLDDQLLEVESSDPEQEAVLADSVGLALLIVLDTLSPAERLAFVLHDMFAVPFDEIAVILDRSPEATRQLASRARRRVRGVEPPPDVDPRERRRVVEAFLAAARDGDIGALVAVLAPDVLLRVDGGPDKVIETTGAETVAGRASAFSQRGLVIRRARVNGAEGWVSTEGGRPFSVSAFTVRDGLIAEIDILSDPMRLARLDLVFLED